MGNLKGYISSYHFYYTAVIAGQYPRPRKSGCLASGLMFRVQGPEFPFLFGFGDLGFRVLGLRSRVKRMSENRDNRP